MTSSLTPTPTIPGPEAAPPAWASWGARVVRRLPVARYRTMNWLCRLPAPAFVAGLPGSPLGLRFECDLRNALAREVFFTGRYEPQETALVRRMLGPGGTFVDVGAHWGFFSLLAAERVGPGGRIVAVEADPRIYRALERNFGLNPDVLGRATAVHAAAADAPGVLTLAGFDEAQANWGVSRVVDRPGPGDAATFEVRAEPLDALLDELGVGGVDLVKMDIEGAEALALKGMREGLAAARYRRLLIELHPAQLAEHGVGAPEVIGVLLGAGYRGWTIDHSAAANRRAAYEREASGEGLLRPLDPDGPLDAWPHQLWAAPGAPPFLVGDGDGPGDGRRSA
jgi:FkbM family methyltransferase